MRNRLDYLNPAIAQVGVRRSIELDRVEHHLRVFLLLPHHLLEAGRLLCVIVKALRALVLTCSSEE